MISDAAIILESINLSTRQLEQLEAEYEKLDRNNAVKVLSLYKAFSPLHEQALAAFKTQKILEQLRASFQAHATATGQEFSPSKESDAIEQAPIVFANRAMRFAAKIEGDINRHHGAQTQAERTAGRLQKSAPTAGSSNEPGVSFMPKGWLDNKKK